MAASNPSDGPSSTSASNGFSSAHTPSGPSSFVSQPFSAATEMILKRLRGEGGPLNPISVAGLTTMSQTPAYEDVRRTVLEGMRTSHNMDFAASTPPPRRATKAPRTGSVGARGAGNANGTPASGARRGNNKGGKKRKRAKDESDESAEESDEMSDLVDDDESDDAASITAFPNMTQSGRKVVKPAAFIPEVVPAARKRTSAQMRRTGRSVENALCKRCGRGHSPASNMIVFCDGCNSGWHQMCHDPAISDEAVKDEMKEWFCAECTAKRERKRERGKSNTPNSATSGVGKSTAWAAKSQEEKRAYLSSFPQSHLVSLLLHATTLHPSIPITAPPATSTQQPAPGHRADDSRRVTHHPQQPFPPSATSGLFARAEANPSAPINFIRKLPHSASPSAAPLPSPPPAQAALPPSANNPDAAQQVYTDADAEGEDDEEVSRESTPASPPYPRPGNGLMARLKSDEEDLEWLVGGGGGEEEGAFSHVVFEEQGAVDEV